MKDGFRIVFKNWSSLLRTECFKVFHSLHKVSIKCLPPQGSDNPMEEEVERAEEPEAMKDT